MRKGPYRAYADTSVYGGVFDAEFGVASRAFFDRVREGVFTLVTSAVVDGEIKPAPTEIKQFYSDFSPSRMFIDVTEEAIDLQRAYLEEGILSKKSEQDALHVALATIHHCDFIISWNFKHIVNFEKIPKFNAVNMLMGYGNIAIYSPLEVIPDVKS